MDIKSNCQASKTLNYFTLHETTSTASKIYKCKLCNQLKNGNQQTNLTTHLKLMHTEEFNTHVKTSAGTNAQKMKIRRLKLLQNCVEITTINKQPYAFLSSSGFQNIIQNKLRKLEDAGCGLNLKSRDMLTVKRHTTETATKIRGKIRDEIKTVPFSLSADIVSKNNRSILGIWAQYIIDGDLRVRCLGMEELIQRHSGKYISETIEACLAEYNIAPLQMTSITADNASNMRSSLDHVNDNLEKAMEQDESEQIRLESEVGIDMSVIEMLHPDDMSDSIQSFYDAEISYIVNSSNTEQDRNEIEELFRNDQSEQSDGSDWTFVDALQDLPNALIEKADSSFMLVNGINCAAHTLQLAVNDSLKSMDTSRSNVIKLCRSVAKFIRLSSTMIEMRNRGLKSILPPLDVNTRWSSTYSMVTNFEIWYIYSVFDLWV